MKRLMYVAIVPLILMTIAMLTWAEPGTSASLSGENRQMDVSAMQRSVDTNALPNSTIDPENLY